MHALVAAVTTELQNFLAEFLRQHRCTVTVAAGFSEMQSALQGADVLDMALVEMDLPAGTALRGIEWLRSRFPGARVIGIARQHSVNAVVQAVRLGAEDVVPDPADDIFPLQRAVTRALASRTQGGERDDVARLAAQVGMVLGINPVMWRLASQVVRVARHSFPVLITGETGTGKERFARLVHAASPRARGPFVDVNCGAVPRELQASELFGHQQGAFTGARQTRKGVFELAHGGTLFLDEIPSAPPDVQVSLLRVLETGTFRRVGGEENIRVDVRVVAASNVPLKDLVAEGKFRQDLYYRLDVFTVALPALRERPEDIPILAEHFLRQSLPPELADRAALSPGAIELLCRYPWPGNVRELSNAMAHAAVLTPDGTVQPEHLPPRLWSWAADEAEGPASRTASPPAWTAMDPEHLADAWVEALLAGRSAADAPDLEHVLARWEAAQLRVATRAIRWAMAHTGGNRAEAAAMLGIRVRTLRYLLNEKARRQAEAVQSP